MEFTCSNLKKSYDYSNRELLNAGYQSVLIELANNGVMSSGDDIQLTEKNFWSRLENYKNKSTKDNIIATKPNGKMIGGLLTFIFFQKI